MTISRRAVLFAPLLAAAAPANPFRGIFPIVQTPFLDNGQLDPATLSAEIQFLNRCGVQGLAWPQLASEFWSLTEAERLTGAEAILSAGKGKPAKLVIGVQSDDVETSVRLAKHAAAPGLPLILQAVGKITVEDVIALSKAVPAVKYVKDEAGVTLPRITEFQQKAPQIGVFTGAHGRTMIDELLRGAVGNMPAAGPADLYVKAFALWEKGDHRKAALAFARAAVLIPEFEMYGIEGLKYILELRGVFKNSIVRAPRNGDVGAVATKTKLDEAGRRALRLLWEGVGK